MRTYFKSVQPNSYTIRVGDKLYTFSGLKPVEITEQSHIDRLKAKSDMVEECDAKGRPILSDPSPRKQASFTSKRLSYAKLPKKDAVGERREVKEDTQSIEAPSVKTKKAAKKSKKKGRKKKKTSE